MIGATGRAVVGLASVAALLALFFTQVREPPEAPPVSVAVASFNAMPAAPPAATSSVVAPLLPEPAELPANSAVESLAALPAPAPVEPPPAAREPITKAGRRIALIIDDLGYRPVEGQRAVRLPGPVAVAILPHTPHAEALAREADARGKEVVLHVPMQALDASTGLGPGALSLEQTHEDLVHVLADDLAAVPHVLAVSNHMGSSITREALPMRWIMEELKARPPLFFVDSYTTAESVALDVARETGVRALRRNVFLDGDPAPEAVRREWLRLIGLARTRGFAVGIGHPHPATLDFLERELPALAESGVELVTLVQLLEGPPTAE